MGAGEDGLELFSIRDLPELGAGRKTSELLVDEELADGTREELRPIGLNPPLTRELDSPEEAGERDVAVDRVSRPPNRLQPSFPPRELDPGVRTEEGLVSPPLTDTPLVERLPERTEELPDVALAPLVSGPVPEPTARP